MYTKSALIASAFVAVAHARFGQENSVQGIINAIGGNNGQAATLAGASIGTLLAGANACAKLSLADQVAALDGAGALDAAKALVQAEKNFNPFVVSIPSFCSDASLPATAALRGILPLVDPSVDGAAAQNAASAASLNTPVNADGLSVADIVAAQGDVNFTPQSAAGATGAEVAAGGNANAGNNNANAGDNNANAGNNNNNTGDNNNNGGNDTADNAADNTADNTADTGADDNADTGADTGAATSTDLQTFTSAIGAAPDPITFSGNADRPFQVAGDTFVNFGAAAARTCDRQFNACANAANGGKGVAFADCNTQKNACNDAQSAATVTSFDTAAAAQPAANTGSAGDTEDTGVCQQRRLTRREEAKKRQEKSRREALVRDILKKRAELAVLESALLK